MKSRTKNIIRGAGSVVDILPRVDFRRHAPTRTVSQRMQERWQRVGASLHRSIVQVQHEQTVGKRPS
jgi:hypothetical protein